jgi:hypothetical protein
MVYKEARELATPLTGDPTLLDDIPNDESLPLGMQVVVNVMGSAAKKMGRWVAVSAPHFLSFYERLPFNPLMHPGLWMKMFGPSSQIAGFFREAEAQGLIVVVDDEREGYFYEPTQALADIIMATVRSSTPET